MSLAKKILNQPGSLFLNLPEERAEMSIVLKRDVSPLKLRYLRGSRQMGVRLWDVLAPQLPEYGTYGGMNGYPTFSLPTLREKGLIK